MADNDKSKLFAELQQVGFVLKDLNLYLDTHPNDAMALKYQRHYQALHKQLLEQYTTQYGPITANNVNTQNTWTWVEGPWPWEGEM